MLNDGLMAKVKICSVPMRHFFLETYFRERRFGKGFGSAGATKHRPQRGVN